MIKNIVKKIALTITIALSRVNKNLFNFDNNFNGKVAHKKTTDKFLLGIEAGFLTEEQIQHHYNIVNETLISAPKKYMKVPIRSFNFKTKKWEVNEDYKPFLLEGDELSQYTMSDKVKKNINLDLNYDEQVITSYNNTYIVLDAYDYSINGEEFSSPKGMMALNIYNKDTFKPLINLSEHSSSVVIVKNQDRCYVDFYCVNYNILINNCLLKEGKMIDIYDLIDEDLFVNIITPFNLNNLVNKIQSFDIITQNHIGVMDKYQYNIDSFVTYRKYKDKLILRFLLK